MWKSPAISYLVGHLTQLGVIRAQVLSSSYSTVSQAQVYNLREGKAVVSSEDQHHNQVNSRIPEKNAGGENRNQIRWNVSRKDKINFLVKTLLNLNDSKEDVYGTLDGWVAWEQDFPIGKLRIALIALEKEQQWHRIIQVIKWMVSKGQGTTMGTYGQLIRALDMDQRPEEAHKFWQKKIGMDLHAVPWQLCKSMISMYYRNNMLENLVKLFEGLEAFDRKPPQKSIVRKVADAYEILGRLEKKERVLEKYNYLFTEDRSRKKPKNALSKEKKKLV
ncbi:pentatricopeptide repeat-containing protein At4g18975, chloroplastic [Argentina anserina]|uniref:pentatricopeptide repeat-containing protein At4g18975, chloroplastic n=1 Tax=Argentina anserina TaxID=57926 RepID=UPI0021762157|nr:pentatricopeptide repeat-containing protein At4g18975, chloroplastic [Potentilla anserina]